MQYYRQGALEKLLEEPPKTGRRKKIDVETIAQLQKELSDPFGFSSYNEVKLWFYTCQNLEVNYSTIGENY